jgi:hypothetical protein
VEERRKKFRNMGEYSTYFKEALKEEVAMLQKMVLRGLRRRKADKKLPAEETGTAD